MDLLELRVSGPRRADLLDKTATKRVLPLLIEHAKPLCDVGIELVHPGIAMAGLHDHVAHLDLPDEPSPCGPAILPPGPRED